MEEGVSFRYESQRNDVFFDLLRLTEIPCHHEQRDTIFEIKKEIINNFQNIQLSRPRPQMDDEQIY